MVDKSDRVAYGVYFFIMICFTIWLVYFVLLSNTNIQIKKVLINNFNFGILVWFFFNVGLLICFIFLERIINKIFYPLSQEEKQLNKQIKSLKKSLRKKNIRSRIIDKQVNILRTELKLKNLKDDVSKLFKGERVYD